MGSLDLAHNLIHHGYWRRGLDLNYWIWRRI